MELEFSGPIFEWRGPAPFYFVDVPEPQADQLHEMAAAVTYGWGMIPATLQIGDTEWTTSLWPRHGGYVVPLKDRIRRAERLEKGDLVQIRLTLRI